MPEMVSGSEDTEQGRENTELGSAALHWRVEGDL